MSDVPCKPRQVVCAAIRKEGFIICGSRHFSPVMRECVKRLGYTFGGWEQGFVDQWDVFLTREEAFKLARERGQIKEEIREGKVHLISENLY